VEAGEREAVHCVEAPRLARGVENARVFLRAGLDKETAVSMIGLCVRYNETSISVAMKRGPQGPPHTSPVATEMGVSAFNWACPLYKITSAVGGSGEVSRAPIIKLQAMRCITRASIGKGVGCNSRGGGTSCV